MKRAKSVAWSAPKEAFAARRSVGVGPGVKTLSQSSVMKVVMTRVLCVIFAKVQRDEFELILYVQNSCRVAKRVQELRCPLLGRDAQGELACCCLDNKLVFQIRDSCLLDICRKKMCVIPVYGQRS